MRSRSVLLIVYIFLAAAGIYVVVSAFGFEAWAYPAVLGFILIGCSVLQIIRILRQPRAGGKSFIESFTPKQCSVLLTMLASMIYVFLLMPLGFIIASLLFMSSLMWLLGYRDPLRVAVVSLTTSIGLYFFFTRIVHIDLPTGILPF